MPTPFELMQVAKLVKLAADTAEACSQVKANGEMARIMDAALRIKAGAEELEQIGRKMKSKASEDDA